MHRKLHHPKELIRWCPAGRSVPDLCVNWAPISSPDATLSLVSRKGINMDMSAISGLLSSLNAAKDIAEKRW